MLRYAIIASFFLLAACKPLPQIFPKAVEPKLDRKAIVKITGNQPLINPKTTIYHDIRNKQQCVPLDMSLAIGGVRPRTDRTLQYKAKPLSDRSYAVEFSTGAFRDQDFYGLGVCHWEPTIFVAQFSVDGIKYQAAKSLGSSTLEQKLWCYGGRDGTGNCMINQSPNPRATHDFTALITLE